MPLQGPLVQGTKTWIDALFSSNINFCRPLWPHIRALHVCETLETCLRTPKSTTGSLNMQSNSHKDQSTSTQCITKEFIQTQCETAPLKITHSCKFICAECKPQFCCYLVFIEAETTCTTQALFLLYGVGNALTFIIFLNTLKTVSGQVLGLFDTVDHI